MKPTQAPDDTMENYGMYDNYEDYDEDDFFYHMYFDEVSTTPLPDEFYDILESVSNQYDTGLNYPDYFDYKYIKSKYENSTELKDTTDSSSRQSKNTRYLNFGSSPRRRNSKLLKLKSRTITGREGVRYRSSKVNNYSEKIKVRSKRGTQKKRKSKKLLRSGFRKRKQLERGIIGNLDRRIPLFFRQSPFVTVALTKFVILSTGVTTGKCIKS